MGVWNNHTIVASTTPSGWIQSVLQWGGIQSALHTVGGILSVLPWVELRDGIQMGVWNNHLTDYYYTSSY